MADLLADIEAAAIDDKVSTVSLLRKALVLASALKSSELREWGDGELDGYRGDDEWATKTPVYRRFHARALGNFNGYGGVIWKALVIPPSTVPENFRRYATIHTCLDGIANYESLLERGAEGESSETLQVPWPADLLVVMRDHEICSDMVLYAAWQEIPRNSIAELVANVRTRLLRFVLDLRVKSPGIKVETSSQAGIPADVIHKAFVTYIQGENINVAIDSQGVTQNIKVRQGDIASLAARLTQLGVGGPDIEELKRVLEGEAKPPEGLGARCRAWVSRATEKFLTGALNVSAVSAGSGIAKALADYFGP